MSRQAIAFVVFGCHWWLAHQCATADARTGGRATSGTPDQAANPFRLRLDPGHPWRPPFGLDRVGRPIGVVVESTGKPPEASYALAAFRDGREVSRLPIAFPVAPPYVTRVGFEGYIDTLALTATNGGKAIDILKHPVHPPEFEADAEARPDQVVHPVDLGTVLVPSGWLLLGPGQSTTLDVAALSRTEDLPERPSSCPVRCGA